MPWNDDSNPGPWGAPPNGGSADRDRRPKGEDAQPPAEGPEADRDRSPWNRGPERPAPRPEDKPRPGGPNAPDVEELLRDLRRRADRFFRGGGRRLKPEAVGGVVAAIVGLWALTGVYVVQPGEEAVVTRFGAYAGTALPGLQYHLPWPFENVEKVQRTAVRSTGVGSASADGSSPEETLMLTGDENIVDLDFTVQWRVGDAARFLFTLDDPEQTVRAVAESAMREVVGRTALQPILSNGRGQVQTETAALMQRVLDAYGAGVEVVEVQIRRADPPQDVVPAFRAVVNAGQERESRINEANAYRNGRLAQARGQAAAIRTQAEAYREQAIREAEGSAARFDEVYAQYRSAPDVTRRRLYLETMERALRNSRTVIAPGGSQAPIILPQIPGVPAATTPPVVAPAAPAQGAAR